MSETDRYRDYRINTYSTADPPPHAHVTVRISNVKTNEFVQVEGEQTSITEMKNKAWEKMDELEYGLVE